MASAAEAETGGVFGNAQKCISIRRALTALGHPQPATPIKTDNSTTNNFVHANLRQKRSKTWDMKWNWLRDRETQNHLNVYWDKGSNNNADYFTKHHPPIHHRMQRPVFILKNNHASQKRSISPAALKSAIITQLNSLTVTSCEGVLDGRTVSDR